MNESFNLSRMGVAGAINLCVRAGIHSKTRDLTQGSRALDLR